MINPIHLLYGISQLLRRTVVCEMPIRNRRQLKRSKLQGKSSTNSHFSLLKTNNKIYQIYLKINEQLLQQKLH